MDINVEKAIKFLVCDVVCIPDPKGRSQIIKRVRWLVFPIFLYWSWLRQTNPKTHRYLVSIPLLRSNKFRVLQLRTCFFFSSLFINHIFLSILTLRVFFTRIIYLNVNTFLHVCVITICRVLIVSWLIKNDFKTLL